MKEKYYFIKTRRGNVPLVTVYLLKKDDEWARGVSIKSFRDALNVKIGKKQARSNAYKGLFGKKNDNQIVRGDALDVLDLVNPQFYKKRKRLYKSMYKPVLLPNEKKLLDN